MGILRSSRHINSKNSVLSVVTNSLFMCRNVALKTDKEMVLTLLRIPGISEKQARNLLGSACANCMLLMLFTV